MSRIFYDHLVIVEDLESDIKSVSGSQEEREELWGLVDEIIHHKILILILDKLPDKHHEEFLDHFHTAPDDVGLLTFLKEKIQEDIEQSICAEAESLFRQLREDLEGSDL